METNKIHLRLQDVYLALPNLDSDFFDLCIVDPPYGASSTKNWSYGDKEKIKGFGGRYGFIQHIIIQASLMSVANY